MNADLTFNTIVFKKTFDEKDSSERQSSARGINTPDKLTVRSQDYIDSVTKVAGRRYTTRIDRYTLDANLAKICTSMYVVAQVPSTAAQADVDTTLATFKAAVADATLLAGVLNNEK